MSDKSISITRNLVFNEPSQLNTKEKEDNNTNIIKQGGGLAALAWNPIEDKIKELSQQQSILKNEIKEITKNTWLTSPNIVKKSDQLEAKLDHLKSEVEKLQDQINEKTNLIINNFSKKESELDERIMIYSQTYEEFKQKIEELLPSALSTGLASSYKAAKESFTKKIWAYIALIAALCVAIGYFAWNNFQFYQNTSPALIDIFSRFLLQLPFVGLFIWLIAFVTTKLNGEIRLHQEYAHKEAIASSYSSFKQQIESIGGDQQQELLQKLMHQLIDNVSFNPSNTLDTNSKLKTPINEVLEVVKHISDKIPTK